MHIRNRPCVASFAQLLEHGSPTFHRYTMKNVVGGVARNEQTTATTVSYNVDFLQIDVEGADLSILRLIDFDNNVFKPLCIHYEQHHLGMDKATALEFVRAQGYTTRDLHMDVPACQVEQ